MRILRLLATRPLPCGCLAGVYETYDGPIATILDARGDDCPDVTHQPGIHVRDTNAAGLPGRPERQPARRVAG